MNLHQVLTDNFYTVYGPEIFFIFAKYMRVTEEDNKLIVEINHPSAETITIIVKDSSLTIHTCGEVFNFLDFKKAFDLAVLTNTYTLMSAYEDFKYEVTKQFFEVA